MVSRLTIEARFPERLLEVIVAGCSDAVIVVDSDGKIVLTNPVVSFLFGYRPDEICGRDIEMLLPLKARADHLSHFNGFLADPHVRQLGSGLNLEGLHRDGQTFKVDIALRPMQFEESLYVVAFVRDAREPQRQMDRLRAVSEITQRLLKGSPTEEVLQYFAEQSRILAEATASWVVVPSDSGQLVICAADGPGTASLIGLELPMDSSRSGMVMKSGVPELIPQLSLADNIPPQVVKMNLGSSVYLPLVSDGRHLGALVIARSQHGAPFDPLDIALAEIFAGATAAAIRLGEEREEFNRLILIEEDERIARDLHDTVIQQLFAVGMSLQAVRPDATGKLGERIDIAVDRLDDVIRDIRNTIFRLPGRTRQIQGLREEMFSLADRYAIDLGFTPHIEFHGAVEIAIPDDVAVHLLFVLSEALSNIARHAHASAAEVRVSIDNGWLSSLVVDDGTGLAAGAPVGNGLRNMMARATALGGTFKVEAGAPSGTVVEWSVPVRT